jgi:hypothetical protein
LTWLVLCFGLASATSNPREVADPRWRGGWVTDDADVLSAAAEARIDAQGDAVQRTLGFELVLVTVVDVPGTADELVMDLFARWELGSIRGRGAVLGLWVADRAQWAWRIGPGVDGSALATPPLTAAELEPWYHRVSVSLFPAVEPPRNPAFEPAVPRSLHPWLPWAALGFCLLLIGVGSKYD